MQLICSSYFHLFKEHLVDEALSDADRAEAIFLAPFVVVSHDRGSDPVFNFGNQQALDLWEMRFDEFVGLPSRYSAELEHREERARLLQAVEEQDYFREYRGIRTSKTGRRFMIQHATVFNLLDADGKPAGQAATFNEWRHL